MKRTVLFILLLLIGLTPVCANTRITVTLAKCTDGDTAHFMLDGKDTTVRFLAIDTPESTNEKEPYGKEASEFTCQLLQEAKVIELEYDAGSDRTDKYGRTLAWVFADGKLLQKELVANGLAEVMYIYGDYAYTEELYQVQDQAKQAKLNIWSEAQGEETPYWIYIATLFGAVLILLLSLSNVKGKKRKINKVKKVMKQLNQR